MPSARTQDTRAKLISAAMELFGLEWRLPDAALDESSANFASGSAGAPAIDVSPDGRTIALGLANGAVELRQASDGALIAEIGRHAEAISSLGFDPRGERLLICSTDHTVVISDAVPLRVRLAQLGPR
jgi:WD40 repeat protein